MTILKCIILCMVLIIRGIVIYYKKLKIRSKIDKEHMKKYTLRSKILKVPIFVKTVLFLVYQNCPILIYLYGLERLTKNNQADSTGTRILSSIFKYTRYSIW